MKVKTKQAANLFFSDTSLQYVYFEAIANSIDAGAKYINIAIDLPSFSDPGELSIVITDNGKGFDDKSFERFSNLLDKSDDQHKGIGRLVYLKYFHQVEVESIFGSKHRTFTFNDRFDGESKSDDLDADSHEEKYQTKIRFTGYSKDKIYSYEYISCEKIRIAVLHHFLPRLYQLKLDKKELVIEISVATDDPKPEHDFYPGSSKLDIAELPELREKVIQKENFMPDETSFLNDFRMLYSIDRVGKVAPVICAICADSRTIPMKIISNRNFPVGYSMIFILYSDYFNGKTNITREEFTFEESALRQIKAIFTKLVSEVVKEEIPEIQQTNQEIQHDLQTQYPHLVGYFDEETIGLSDKTFIVEAAQKKFLSDQKEILEATKLTDTQYELSLNFSSRILTEYVLYRTKIIQKLKDMSTNNNEHEIHDLIVPRKQVLYGNTKINDIFLNNAWVLDDKYMGTSKN
jgi:Skp family chaperone for outer membrane proteins